MWLHGGGFGHGASNSFLYDARHVVTGKGVLLNLSDSFDGVSESSYWFKNNSLLDMNVIIVTINYRLGVLGFLALDQIETGEVSNANFGLQDQVAAIKWVAENIEDFGGDKERITVHGQSAGATSTSLHLLNTDVMTAIKVLFLLSTLKKHFSRS